MAEPVQFNLKTDDLPTAWYNILPDMAKAGMPPLPPLHPGTHQPVGPQDLAPLFPEALIMQEVSTEPWIDIPGAVLDVYRLWRPTPLYRARRLEQALKTPAHIYFKYEGSRTPPSRRRTTTRKPASGGSPPRLEPDSGGRRSRFPRSSSAWTAWYSW